MLTTLRFRLLCAVEPLVQRFRKSRIDWINQLYWRLTFATERAKKSYAMSRMGPWFHEETLPHSDAFEFEDAWNDAQRVVERDFAAERARRLA